MLGDGSGSLRNSVFSKLAWQTELGSGLDISGCESSALPFLGDLHCSSRDVLVEINQQGVDRRNSDLGDTELRMSLLQDSEDVDADALVLGESLGFFVF